MQKNYLKTMAEPSVDVVKHLPCTLTIIQRNVLNLFYCFLHFTQIDSSPMVIFISETVEVAENPNLFYIRWRYCYTEHIIEVVFKIDLFIWYICHIFLNIEVLYSVEGIV